MFFTLLLATSQDLVSAMATMNIQETTRLFEYNPDLYAPNSLRDLITNTNSDNTSLRQMLQLLRRYIPQTQFDSELKQARTALHIAKDRYEGLAALQDPTKAVCLDDRVSIAKLDLLEEFLEVETIG